MAENWLRRFVNDGQGMSVQDLQAQMGQPRNALAQ